MLNQFKMKQMKLLRGIYRTWIRRHHRSYAADSWWDDKFFRDGISDSKTISPDKDIISSAYHYNSVELLILRHLRNRGKRLTEMTVFDLGSGSGHWIDFYLSLGASHCEGVDISHKSYRYLVDKYKHMDHVKIHLGRLVEVLSGTEGGFDIVNAIGIMFHLVEDQEWADTLAQVARILSPTGLFIVGGHFGILNNLNVQFDSDNTVNKRLRSARHWKRVLEGLGFKSIHIYRNRSYLFIEDTVPENNVLVAEKP